MTVRLAIHVQPRASRNAVVGWHGDAVKVALTAPPVDGAANAALLALLAGHFGLRKQQVRLLQGDSSRQKLVELDIAAAELAARLPAR